MAALDQLERLPESVRDSKLRVIFRYDGQQQYTVHPRGIRGRLGQKEDVWVRIKTIGAGGHGSVDLQCKESPRTGLPTQLRAVKNIRIPEAELLSNRDFYVRELETIAKFSSLRYGELFVKSLGWFTSEDTLHIAMDYCRLGDLQRFLSNKCPGHLLPEDQTREIASQVLEAITCMHEEFFAHRDIKPANILIQSHPPESPWAVKLADFGISRRSLGHEMNSTTTIRGTPGFWPPELHGFVISDNEGYCNLYATDMWCFGETLFRVLTGQATFGDMAKLSKFAFGQIDFPEAILKGLSVSDGGVAFLRSLIVCNPGDRLTASGALEHPWFGQDILDSYWEQPSTPLAEDANATDLPYRHQETTGPSAVWPTRSSLEDVETVRQSLPSSPASQPSKHPQSSIRRQLRPSTRDEQPIIEGWEPTAPTTASASWPTERSKNHETHEQINTAVQTQIHGGHSDSLARIFDNANTISGKNSTTSNAEDEKQTIESDKELPLVPAAFEPRDRISFLTFKLQEVANRRVKLSRAIDQSTSLLPKDSLWSNAEEQRKRKEGKKKIEAIREEIIKVQREEHELGLKLHRAYQRQDQENVFPRWKKADQD